MSIINVNGAYNQGPYDYWAYDSSIQLYVPAPAPTIPVASSHDVRYLFGDLFTGEIIAELPLNGFTFTLALNQAGPWSGTLAVEDPRLSPGTDWITATAPNKTAVWVQIDGVLVYGGIVQTRHYTMSAQQVELSGADFWAYLAQRIQAKDYSTQWATQAQAASAIDIGYTMISDALAAANSIPLNVVKEGEPASEYDITFAAPINEAQSVQSWVSQFCGMGYLVGFDFAVDVEWKSGYPVATLTLSYPRRGRVAGSTGLMIDVASAVEFVYPEDGTQQADKVLEASYATGAGLPTVADWPAAMAVDGYPLLEAVEMHTLYSPVPEPQAALDAFAADDIALYAYPVTVPEVTVDAFGFPALGDFVVGDDVRVVVPKTAGGGPPQNPRFPEGMDFYWRITKAAVSIADEGLSTMKLSLNVPPSSTPIRPPS